LDAQKIRDLAERCRELHRVAIHQEVNEQLRQWAIDFEAEAEAMKKVVDYGGAIRSGEN
jgi:hypothetical protein